MKAFSCSSSYMKKLLLLVLIMIVALLMSGASDSKASIADTSIPSNETSDIDNSDSASATITITWTTALKEQGEYNGGG